MFYCPNNLVYRSKQRTRGLNFQNKGIQTYVSIVSSIHPSIHPDGRNFTIGKEKKRISLRRASISQMYRFISISYRLGGYSRMREMASNAIRDAWNTRANVLVGCLGGGVPETAISRRLSSATSCKVSSSSVDTWRGSVPSSRPSRPIAIIPKHRAATTSVPLSRTSSRLTTTTTTITRDHWENREQEQGRQAKEEKTRNGELCFSTAAIQLPPVNPSFGNKLDRQVRCLNRGIPLFEFLSTFPWNEIFHARFLFPTFLLSSSSSSSSWCIGNVWTYLTFDCYSTYILYKQSLESFLFYN